MKNKMIDELVCLVISLFNYISSNNIDKCNEHCFKAIKLCKQIVSNKQDIENIGDIFQNIAELYLNDNNYRQATKYYKKSIKIYENR
jgi:tetratricopeptide (TPR) repeat protein